MRCTLVLVASFAVLQAALAQVLEDGNYVIHHGSWRLPHTNRYLTVEDNFKHGLRMLPHISTGQTQLWKLKNRSSGLVTFESRSSRGKYLSLGPAGARPEAQLVLTTTAQRFNITQVAGGQFTGYVVAYPKKVSNKTLVMSLSDGGEPQYAVLINQDTEGRLPHFKITYVP